MMIHIKIPIWMLITLIYLFFVYGFWEIPKDDGDFFPDLMPTMESRIKILLSTIVYMGFWLL